MGDHGRGQRLTAQRRQVVEHALLGRLLPAIVQAQGVDVLNEAHQAHPIVEGGIRRHQIGSGQRSSWQEVGDVGRPWRWGSRR